MYAHARSSAFWLPTTKGFGPLLLKTYNRRVSEFFCYILECADGTFYTGWTTDPQRRVQQHNQGNGSRYTRMRRPVHLVYLERQPDRSTAQKRELYLKALNRTKKSVLIDAYRASTLQNS